MKTKTLYGAIDIGNSRIKIAIENDDTAFRFKDPWETGIYDFMRKYEDKKMIIGISSVNAPAFRRTIKLFAGITNSSLVNDNEPDKQPYIIKSKDKNFAAVKGEYLLSIQKVVDFSNIEGMGIDRSLGIIGAAQRCTPPFFTVDCGTAITINAVDKTKTCLGGAIMSGIFTQIKALAQAADKIIFVKLDGNFSAAGKNTDEALKSGVVGGTGHAIIGIVKDIFDTEMKYDKFPPILLTGGYADVMFELLSGGEYDVRWESNLILDGIIYLLKSVKFEF
ncbi:MAG: type pantothenate kinase [Bacteroidota bacterium]|nr:type pantothenate kinase [Bacteroidota bacterium]